MRRAFVILAAGLLMVSATGGCSSLNFVKRRLPPPTQTATLLVGSMQQSGSDGIWVRTEKLPPGRYQYKFVIDRVNWKEDPNNPNRTDDGYGGFNSLLDVR